MNYKLEYNIYRVRTTKNVAAPSTDYIDLFLLRSNSFEIHLYMYVYLFEVVPLLLYVCRTRTHLQRNFTHFFFVCGSAEWRKRRKKMLDVDRKNFSSKWRMCVCVCVCVINDILI